MKVFLLSMFVATICVANAGKTQRLLAAMAAMNAGVGGVGVAGMANGINPALLAAGLNPSIVPQGVGLIAQPQFAQMFPGIPQFAFQAPAMNPSPFAAPMYPVPQVNAIPYMGIPQMGGANPAPQQGVLGGPVQQPLARFKRHVMKLENSAVDTQTPAPTATPTTPTPCEHHLEEQHP